MKIGYPCINYSIGCKADKTVRIKYYNEDKHRNAIQNNLDCLKKIINFNIRNGLFFHRISSETIPLATYENSQIDRKKEFENQIKEIGKLIKQSNIRISMHPDHFVVLNSNKENVVQNSINELFRHAEFLDIMGLDSTAKIQIHVGGAYGDKQKAIENFIKNYKTVPEIIKKRLVIENDDYIFSLNDCLKINESIGVPIIFDTLHQECNNNGEGIIDGLYKAGKTWTEKDGIPMIDYSTQKIGEKKGKHADSIDIQDFSNFIQNIGNKDFDIMFEIKDKEESALKAKEIIDNF